MTTASPVATSPQSLFRSLDEEARPAPSRSRGSCPTGWAARSCGSRPAMLEPGGDPVRHFFDGLAMLNAFTLTPGGGVSYASRFLQSQAYRNVLEHGETRQATFGSDPCRSIFRRVTSMFTQEMTDNCNVNVTRLGERWVALTETPVAVEFDPATLDSGAQVTWAGKREHATAHPERDFRRHETVGYGVHFARRSAYRLLSTPDGADAPVETARVPVREPAYMHSFAMTDRYAVLIDQPFVVNPLRLAFGGKSFIENYEWKPERGTRFLVIDRERGTLHATVEAEAMFCFHTVNMFEDGGELVLDLSAYDDPRIISELHLAELRDGHYPSATGELRRYRLPLAGGSARREDLGGHQLELPRINYRRHGGRSYRYVYGASQSQADFLDSLIKVDVSDGSAIGWREDGCYPGEPVFVASGGAAEDDGVLLSVVLDAAADASFLLVLDARDLTELARARAPHAIPFGFHGDFARAVS